MQLEHEKPDTPIYVKHYEAGKITLSKGTFDKSVIITPQRIIKSDWIASCMVDISSKIIEILIELNADIYLLGLRSSAIPTSQHRVTSTFLKLRKSIDFMSAAAACRTFNILAHEGRNVVASVIV